MFATLAEADKAASIVRRTTGRHCALGGRPHESWRVLAVLPTGEEQTLRDWGEVADFVLHFAPKEQEREDERAQTIADAKDWLQIARNIDPALPTEKFQALLNAVSRIVEVLG